MNCYQAGTAVRDVTPPLGYRLQGHDVRTQPSVAVHDPLHVKALSVSDGQRRVIMVAADLLCFAPAFVKEFRQAVSRELGIEAAQVMITATHTHTGPFLYAEKPGDAQHLVPGYLESLRDKIIDAVREAMAREEPADLLLGTCEADIGVINRRLVTPHGVEMSPNPGGPVDHDVLVLASRKRDGRLGAILCNYSCHPTTLDTSIAQISADFPGVAQRVMEERCPGASALFLNGCSGDIRPNLTANGRFRGGSFAEIERMGIALADAALAALDRAELVAEDGVAGCLEAVELPLDPAWLPDTPERLAEAAAYHLRCPVRDESVSGAWYTPSDGPAVDAWKAEMAERIRRGERLASSVPMEVQVFRIGDAWLIGLAGEVMVDIGRKLKAVADPRTIVGSCANGSVGYIPTADAIFKGGYEAKSFLYQMYPAPYSESMERTLIERTLSLIQGIAPPLVQNRNLTP